MITLLIIIFIICVVVMKIKDTPEQEREHVQRYLGEDFATKDYCKTVAKKQIKQEDKQLLIENNNSAKLSFKLGQTRRERIKERTAELMKEEQNNK